MKRNLLTTLILPIALVEMLRMHYGTTNTSKAILCGFLEFLMLPRSMRTCSNYALHQILTAEQIFSTCKVSMRIPEALLSIIRSFPDGDTTYEKATLILAQILYSPLDAIDFSKEPKKLISILGSKYDDRMQKAISTIFETAKKKWNLSVETCAGALGIHNNFGVARHEIINDDDNRKINLYRTIQKCPFEFMLSALSLDVNRDTFLQTKNLNSRLTTADINVDAAVRFQFLNTVSYLHEGSTYNDQMSTEKYQRSLSSVYPLYQRLQHTKICEMDIFKIIEKYRKQSDVLFIVDPPYLDTNVYKGRCVRSETSHGTEFGWQEHKKLARLLQLVKKNNGNDFIYFCRITATRKRNRENQCVMTDAEIASADRYMHGRIDELYWGHGFYYLDVELDNGTIERIITSFPFEGSTLYGKESELEVV